MVDVETGGNPAEETPAAKPGWQTTEFWIALLGTIAAFLTAQGIAPEGSLWEKALALAVIILGSLGYTASRAVVKRERIRAASMQAVARIQYQKDS